jgi:hypothetical protein
MGILTDVTAEVSTIRVFDFNDLGPQIAENQGPIRPGDVLGKVQDTDPLQYFSHSDLLGKECLGRTARIRSLWVTGEESPSFRQERAKSPEAYIFRLRPFRGTFF